MGIEYVISFRGMIILGEQLALTKSIEYSTVEINNSTPVRIFHVKANTDQSQQHTITVDLKESEITCDCFVFNNFHIICRHILCVFMKNDSMKLIDFVNGFVFNSRWLKTNDTYTPSMITRNRNNNSSSDRYRKTANSTLYETINSIKKVFVYLYFLPIT
jgi:hypothetical protein